MLAAFSAWLLTATRAAETLAWEDHGNFRSAALSGTRTGDTGFSLLGPTSTGIHFTNILSKDTVAKNQILMNGSGVAAGDVDGDGLCDLYFCRLEGPNVLYRNLGNWQFADITESAGVGCDGQYSTGAVFADLDGDGDLDLLVNGVGSGTRCFFNDGKGHFVERNSGLIRKFGSMSMALADVDGDGDMDLYVANYRTTTVRSTGLQMLMINGKKSLRPEDRDRMYITPDGWLREYGEPDVLYLNDGKGNFTPASWLDGRFIDENGKALTEPPKDWGLSVMFRDINGDGAPDLYVCNDFWTPDRLWINDGKGHFRAAALDVLPCTSTFSMGIDFADINRDGWDDFLVLDMLGSSHARRMAQASKANLEVPLLGGRRERLQVEHNTLFLSRGDGTFTEISQMSHLQATDWSWCPVFLDVDLDGFEDLLVTTGNIFDTQDTDANNQIDAKGPWPRDKIPFKLLMYPPLALPKKAFRNRGDLTFEETGHAWGFDQVGVAQGIALADLDNDGDLDVIVNHLNGPAGVYRNESAAPRLTVRLKGASANTQGIGARIKVSGGAVPYQSQEMISGGRYLSSDDSVRTFAAGNVTNQMRIEVAWRSGKKSVIEKAKANHVYEITEADSVQSQNASAVADSAPIFEDVSGLIAHAHREEVFEDFERQPLLPNRLSQLGPGVSWIDVDQDGREDLIIGAGKGGSMAVYRNDGHGAFTHWNELPFSSDVTRDQTTILGWSGAGGNLILLAGSSNGEDGLAAGGSVRQYNLATKSLDDALPGRTESTGPLALADWDGDGDLDLFVGGRVIPGRYPEAASSCLFENRDGRLILDERNTKALRQVGLVSGAVWTDLDGDGYPELVLACEWGPLRVFRNQKGVLLDATEKWGLAKRLGWWNGVTSGDFDGDGRMDLVASNWGLNTKYQANTKSPRRLYYGNFAGSGQIEIVESSFDSELGKWVPERDLDALARSFPMIREQYRLYRDFAQAGVDEIWGDRLKQAAVLEANWLETTVFLNRGDHFEIVPLPSEAQWSPAFGVSIADLDGDGNEDIFLSQNFFAVQPESPKNNAGRGLWLKGNGKGGFEAVPGQTSGIKAYGDQRGCALCDYDGDGRVDLVIGQNQSETKLYHNLRAKKGLRIRLKGPSGNPQGIGATLRLIFDKSETGPAREIHGGGGYWSEDSPVQVMAIPRTPVRVQIRWPGGTTTTTEVPAGAAEITVDSNGAILHQQ